MKLNQIYAPVNDDLTKVEIVLKEVGQVDFPWLAEMLQYSLEIGGKRVRPVLTLLSGHLYNYRFEVLLPMAAAIELMHTATLIHDDAIDKSEKRRSRPTIYKLWGVDPAVLLGDYLFARAGVEVSNTHSIRAIRLFSQTLMTISRGELIQAKYAFNLDQSREDYFNRIYGKTASLFCLSTESGGILSQAPESAITTLRAYGRNLGLAFQIIDDILDFTSTEGELGKPAGSDLAQGTLTLPAIILNERYPGDNPVKRLFQDRTQTDYVRQSIEQVRNSSIVEECYRIAKGYCDNAYIQISKLPCNSSRQSLTELCDFVLKRKS